MPREPRNQPIVPSYGTGSLADLSASVLASLVARSPDDDSLPNVLGLPPVRRACVLLADGLGWELLRDHPAAAPFLAELAFRGGPLTCGFPSTTVTSLASLGTGRPPGEHGLLGYQVAVPGEGRLLNGLRWARQVDPVWWQPLPTIYERAVSEGIGAYRVASSSLRETGLSSAVMRGSQFWPANGMGPLAAQAVAAMHDSERALVIVYHQDLDGAGHEFGANSDAWTFQLAHVDKLAEQIASALPPGSALYITGDHGTVNVGADDRIDADQVAALRSGVSMLGGEPRARHIYAKHGAAGDVLDTWRGILGDRAWILPREEAVKEGWFGPVADEMVPRIGDVVVAMAGTSAVVASKAEPREAAQYGMHGSLTPTEQLIPFLTYTTL
jgi:hypothetical protein